MLEWLQSWPAWLQGLWFIYITFHDPVQWAVMAFLAHTAWGQRQKKKEAEALVEHIHRELHQHIEEDSSFHRDLGQAGMTKGK